jgi:hypothetical protein
MKTIPLTQGKVAIVNDALLSALSQFKWCAKRDGRTFYAMRRVARPGRSQTTVCMHREVFRLRGEKVPKQIDHRNRNGLDNRRRNLRPATHTQNQRNQRKRKDNTSGFTGVRRDHGRWRAYVRVNGKNKHLGMFGNKRAAARVRDQYIHDHFPEFGVAS